MKMNEISQRDSQNNEMAKQSFEIRSPEQFSLNIQRARNFLFVYVTKTFKKCCSLGSFLHLDLVCCPSQ